MKSILIPLLTLLACLPLWSQERLPRAESLKYAFFLSVELRDLLGTPIPTDPDVKRPVAVRAGDRGALLLPEAKLTEQALKSAAGIVPVGQLWLVKAAPVADGQPVPSSKLRLIEVKAEAGQATAACCALAVSRNADNALQLLVYGKEKEPLLKVPLTPAAAETNPDTPLDLSVERTDNGGKLTLKLPGKFQAAFAVAEAEY